MNRKYWLGKLANLNAARTAERGIAPHKPLMLLISGNDDPRNGLALTPDAHWTFDQGLWTAVPKGDHFLIKVASSRYTESAPNGRLLSSLDGKPLHFHTHSRLRPDPANLEWHARHHRV